MSFNSTNAVSFTNDASVKVAVSNILKGRDNFHTNKVLMSTMTHIIKLMADVGTTKSLQKAYVLLTAMEVCLNDKRLFNLKNSDHHIKTAADVCKLKSVVGNELINKDSGMVSRFFTAFKQIFN